MDQLYLVMILLKQLQTDNFPSLLKKLPNLEMDLLEMC